MRKMLVFIFSSFLQILHIFCSTSFAQTATQPVQEFFSPDFWIKVTIALVSAILAFIGSYVLALQKQRKEPQKQLSYDTTIRKGLVEIESDIRDKVQVLYKNQKIEDLYHIACNIENTGNTVIKNQYIRFDLPADSNIVDYFFEPVPEREIGAQETDEGLNLNEKRYLIKHIERGQRVGFRFLLTSSKSVSIYLHPFNEEGNVAFVPRTISKAQDERYFVSRFVYLYFLYILIPPALYILPRDLGSMAAGLVRGAIVVAILPSVKPVANIIINIISRLSTSKAVEQSISIHDVRADNINIATSGTSHPAD